jgi:hypothetical protein
MPVKIEQCRKCKADCIVGKDAQYHILDAIEGVICDECSGVRRCPHCNTVIYSNGFCFTHIEVEQYTRHEVYST